MCPTSHFNASGSGGATNFSRRLPTSKESEAHFPLVHAAEISIQNYWTFLHIFCSFPSPDDFIATWQSFTHRIVPQSTLPMRLCKEAARAPLAHAARRGDELARIQLAAMDQEENDRICLLSVGLQKAATQGVSMNNASSKNFCPRRKDFLSIHEISPDGVFFPSRPEEFREEVRRQAQRLYGARLFHIDLAFLLEGVIGEASHHPWGIADEPPLHDRLFLIWCAQTPRTLDQKVAHDRLLATHCSSSLSPLEVWYVADHGSDATGIDEISHSMLRSSPWTVWEVSAHGPKGFKKVMPHFLLTRQL